MVKDNGDNAGQPRIRDNTPALLPKIVTLSALGGARGPVRAA